MPSRVLAAFLGLLLPVPTLAGDIVIDDAYARASSPLAKTGAVFMVIRNSGATDDRLVAVATPSANRAELHTHTEDVDGVMRMAEVEDGIPVPAGSVAELRRGGLHIMLMGLTGPLEQGATIEMTLRFETVGKVTVTVPVDNARLDLPGHGG